MVACVGVAEHARAWCRDEAGGAPLRAVLADGAASARLAAALAAAFESKAIGMRSFLEAQLPGASAQHVQAALYCQGLIYHDSHSRRGGLAPLARADELLGQLAADERREVYLARLQQKQARIAAAASERGRAARTALARARKAEFLVSHGEMPRLFDHADVARLNADRPAHDQLELAGGAPGLLRHHCCHPRCPLFLVDLRTPRDRAAAAAAAGAQTHAAAQGRARNHGLQAHLKLFLAPDRTWVRGLHATALQWLAGRPAASRDEFVLAMSSSNADDFFGLKWLGGKLAADPRASPSFQKRTGYTPAEMEGMLDELHAQWAARRQA